MKKGYFITFEGSDGAGKSTQIGLLQQGLEMAGFKVRKLREPGGTPIGEKIRSILKDPGSKEMKPETELLLMSGARAQLVREVIRPALEAGEIVLCDRYYHSTLVYQGFGRKIDQTFIMANVQFAIENTMPDVTFLLYLDEAKAQERLIKRDGAAGQDRFEAEKDTDFHKGVQEGIEWLKSKEKGTGGKLIAINADDTIENLANEIYRCVASRISMLERSQLDTKQIVEGKGIITP